jgi:hypothetical protein
MKKWMRFMNVLAVAGLALVGAQSAHADYSIDTFDDSPNYSVFGGGSDTRSANTISGDRKVDVTQAGDGDVETKVGTGKFRFSSDFDTTGTALITWDIPEPVDLTQGGAHTGIRLTGFADLGGSLTMTIFTDSGDASALFALPLAQQSLFKPFNQFLPGGADFTQVNKITLFFDASATPNVDGVVLGDLRATNAPEPGTMALLGLGGAGMLAKLRRRRRND